MSALVGGVRVAWVLLVVVEVAAAGLTIAGAGAVTVGALAVPVCGAAVACCLVHSSYCSITPSRVSTYVGARVGWLVDWLVVPRAARCLSVSARGGCLWATGWGGGVLGVLWVRDRVGVPLVGVWVASRERACLREAGWWVGDVEVVTFVQELFGL